MSSEQLLIYLNTLPLYVAIPETFHFQLLWGLLMPQKYQLILSIISTYPYQDISDSFAHFESVPAFHFGELVLKYLISI